MPRSPAILVADDDDNDVFLLRRAFEKAGLSNELFVARDGQEAIDYLAGAAGYEDRTRYPLPGLLLLDLKMPRINGFDVLAWMRERPHLTGLPVVVLSSSSHDADVQKARQMGAHEYKIKPEDFGQLVDLVKYLHGRWLDGARPAG